MIALKNYFKFIQFGIFPLNFLPQGHKIIYKVPFNEICKSAPLYFRCIHVPDSQ
jgi:hypothetical protein